MLERTKREMRAMRAWRTTDVSHATLETIGTTPDV
jgi:hypothetical protein